MIELEKDTTLTEEANKLLPKKSILEDGIDENKELLFLDTQALVNKVLSLESNGVTATYQGTNTNLLELFHKIPLFKCTGTVDLQKPLGYHDPILNELLNKPLPESKAGLDQVKMMSKLNTSVRKVTNDRKCQWYDTLVHGACALDGKDVLSTENLIDFDKPFYLKNVRMSGSGWDAPNCDRNTTLATVGQYLSGNLGYSAQVRHIFSPEALAAYFGMESLGDEWYIGDKGSKYERSIKVPAGCLVEPELDMWLSSVTKKVIEAREDAYVSKSVPVIPAGAVLSLVPDALETITVSAVDDNWLDNPEIMQDTVIYAEQFMNTECDEWWSHVSHLQASYVTNQQASLLWYPIPDRYTADSQERASYIGDV